LLPIKPPALRRGDTIGVMAPAGSVKPDLLEKGAAELRRIGYRVILDQGVLAQRGLFAGEHRERVGALLALLENPEIKAIFCARGGYGSNYVIEHLSSAPVLRRLKRLPPRIVMGYSDVTTLLLFFRQKLGWVTFQGPMLTKDFAEGEAGYDRAVFERVLSDSASGSTIESDASILRQGTTEGRLLGGCLSLLVATLGTPDEMDARGAILLLEDIDEPSYRIDRMLFHLRRAGKFRGVKALVFGEMVGCGRSSPSSDLRDVILEALAGWDVPVVFGLRFGHTTGGCLTLPLGVRARLVAREKVKLSLLEPAVSTSLKEPKRISQAHRRHHA
jgi:muramoyltetrapeptide carboxypeptidase